MAPTASSFTRRSLVDSHVHLWDLTQNRYPWLDPEIPATPLLGDLGPIRRNYLLNDYFDDARHHDVVGLIHIQADHDPRDPVNETRWLNSELAKSQVPYAIVAAATLEDPNVATILEAHREYPNVRGVRQSLNWSPDPSLAGAPPPDRLQNRAWRNGLSLLEGLDLSFDLQVSPEQLLGAARLAADFPETRIALDHVGMPVATGQRSTTKWRRGIRALASNENVVAKISGLGMLFGKWVPDTIRPFVEELLAVFGPNRLMVGTNFPIEKLHVSFDAFIAGVVEALDGLDATEQERVLEGNARAFYRLQSGNSEGGMSDRTCQLGS